MIPFEQSLRKLAEREPEKFPSSETAFIWTNSKRAKNCLWWELADEDATQDDLDEILALVGWEYQVGKEWSKEAWWQFVLSKKGDSVANSIHGGGRFPDKLSAAKGALIAVVEHLEGK